MTWFYILLFVSAILFAGQFLLTKQFQRFNGEGLASTLKLSLFAYLTIAIFFFVKAQIGADGFRFGFSWFTLGVTLGIALVSVSCVYLSIKVLGVANMSVYSIFMMMGGIILPSLVGMIFYGEKLTCLKGVSIALMLVAILFTTKSDDRKTTKKTWLYYIGVFLLNGMVGVLFTVHQNQPALSAYSERVNGVLQSNSDVFMSWYGISTALLAGAVMLGYTLFGKKAHKMENAEGSERTKTSVCGKALLSILIGVGYGLANGVGNYFISLSTSPGCLGSSVTFPIVNGGTIIFSGLMGIFLYKEKCTWKTLVGFAIIILSTVLFMIAQ